MVSVDLNGDGAPDAAWARHDFFTGNDPGNSLSVQLNLGDGTLGNAIHHPVTDDSTDIGSGDLDNDGQPDLVVIGEGVGLDNSTIDLYLNDHGSLTHQTATGGEAPQRLVVADLNGDGAADLAMSDSTNGGDDVAVLLNDGDGTFAPEVRYAVPDGPGGIVAGDFDGDGTPDLAVASFPRTTLQPVVSFLLNDGSGVLTLAPDQVVIPNPENTSGSTSLVAADWNGDGRLDLAEGGIEFERVILINQGGLSFTQARYTAGFGAPSMKAADVDGDGDPDLLDAAAGDSFTGDVQLLPNRGDGTFGTPVVIESSHQPVDVDTADYNGDGRLDLAIANQGSGTAAIDPQAADGSFVAPPEFGTFSPPFDLAVADVNADDAPDVAVSVQDPSRPDGIQLALNDGTGTLVTGGSVPAGGSNPHSVVAANLNADSAPDLVWLATPGSFGPTVFVTAMNNGDGTFADPVVHAFHSCQPGHLSTADIDGDGSQDILVANAGTGCSSGPGSDVSVSLNDGTGSFGADSTVALPAPAVMVLGGDLNGDGLTDLAAASPFAPCCGNGDVFVLVATGPGVFGGVRQITTNYGHRELAMTDLNGDGAPDLATANGNSDGLTFPASDTTSVLLNDGAGTFTDVTTLPGEEISNLLNEVAIATGDIDGDGNVDIAVADLSGNDVGVFFGVGGGRFDPHQIRYGIHSAPRDLQLADLNGDGRLDLVGANTVPGLSGSSRMAKAGEGALASARRGVSVLLNRGSASAVRCTIVGTPGPDRLIGTNRPDVICGLGGNDIIAGRAGADLLFGGAGADRLDGGVGPDVLRGYDGRDVEVGGPGSDLLVGGSGNDRLDGTDGTTGNDRLLGGDGADDCRADQGDKLRTCP